ncbi:MAG: hypothetical protein KC492_06120, partial [Myxococcales bacterium]|nr:hypothetical protein [Myxococcales bacterium]
MSGSWSRIAWWSASCIAVVACSLTQSLDGYEGPPEQPFKDAGQDATQDAQNDSGECVLGTKRCGGSCVSVDDPSFGCTGETCAPCAVAAHVQAVCGLSGCEPQGCEDGFASCDDDLTNGCETPLGTPTDCSACAEVCSAPSGDVACDASQLRCVIQKCPAGSGDCNDDPSDGCEDPLNTIDHCGACSNVCPTGFSCTDPGDGFKCACPDNAGCNAGSDGSCVQGLCVCGGTTLCDAGQ